MARRLQHGGGTDGARFDKNPQQSNETNINRPRRPLQLARQLYLADKAAATPSACSRHYLAAGWRGRRRFEPLEARFGCALLDRAILDACRALALPSMRWCGKTRWAKPTESLPIYTPDFAPFLAGLRRQPLCTCMYTVGMLDAVTIANVAATR
jgi:hypothetical protein